MTKMLYVLAFLFPPLICCTNELNASPVKNVRLNTDTASYFLFSPEFPDNIRAVTGISDPNPVLPYDIHYDVQQYSRFGELAEYLENHLHIKDTLANIMMLQRLFRAYETHSGGREIPIRREYISEKRKLAVWIGALVLVYFISMTGYTRAMNVKTRRLQESAAIIEELHDKRNKLEAQIAFKYEKEERLKVLLCNRFDTMKRLANLHYQYEHNPRLLHKKYEEFLGNTVTEEEIASELYKIINEKYDGALDRLRYKHADLTKKDIETCCLLCAGFTSQEICVLYNYKDPNTIYVRTYRIREKLGLDQGAKIEDYIISV